MWQPLEQGEPNPRIIVANEAIGDPSRFEVWQNHLYQVIARFNDETGVTWLSIKRHDRRIIRNWRHFQQIKNEICGPEREGIEIFPAESRLADSANEYHLWVFPDGVQLPMGFREGLVSNDEQVESYNAAPHKGRQQPWEEGLTTGRNEATPYITAEQEKMMAALVGDGS